MAQKVSSFYFHSISKVKLHEKIVPRYGFLEKVVNLGDTERFYIEYLLFISSPNSLGRVQITPETTFVCCSATERAV